MRSTESGSEEEKRHAAHSAYCVDHFLKPSMERMWHVVLLERLAMACCTMFAASSAKSPLCKICRSVIGSGGGGGGGGGGATSFAAGFFRRVSR